MSRDNFESSMQQHLNLPRQTNGPMAIFQLFLEASGQGLGMSDLEGRVFFANITLCRLVGREYPEDLYQQDIFAFYAPQSAKRLREEILPLVLQEGQWVGELMLIDQQGKTNPVIENLFLLRDDTGKPLCFATVITDISERIRMEQELRTYHDHLENLVSQRTAELEKSNALLREEIAEHKNTEKELSRIKAVLDSTSDLAGMASPDGRCLYLNAAGRRMTGFGLDEDLSGRRMQEIHAVWAWPIVEKEGIPAAIAKGVWTGETALQNRDGLEIPVSQVVIAHRKASGELDYLSTIMRDISERKQTEMELQKLASVVMHSSELINLANLDGKMTYLNDAGMKMLGISADEVAGIHITQVIPDHLLEKVQKEVLPAMMAGGWDGDLEYKNLRSGALTSVHANIFLITDSQTGTPLYFANLSRDITGRKKAEEALRKR